MAYLHEDIEKMPREQLKKLQSERLVAQVKRCYENVECFRNRMDEAGLKPGDIHGVEDLHRLPFSYKKDLRDYYPYGLFAVPMKNIVRIHASNIFPLCLFQSHIQGFGDAHIPFIPYDPYPLIPNVP